MLTYHINLNERGSFHADVRRDGQTIYDIYAGAELNDGDSSIFEDGFMRNERDMRGLREYLVDLEVIKENEGEIVFMG